MQKPQPKITIPTIQGTKKQWEALGDNYSTMDSCPQTYFYTLSNMLKLHNATKILEVACGTGKMLPMILDLKHPNAEYYATDISQKMLHILKQKLQWHFQKYQSKLSFQEWMQKMKLKVELVNGEEPLAEQLKNQDSEELHKFDRIIANLVLMLTPDPEKMLLNLFNHSQSGCLFGLTVWGNKQGNTYHTVFPELIKKYNFPEAPPSRSNFHLYQKIESIAQKTGWELVLNWQQNAILPFLQAQESRQYAEICCKRMNHLNQEQQKKLADGFIQTIGDKMKHHKALQFSGDCYILRKP